MARTKRGESPVGVTDKGDTTQAQKGSLESSQGMTPGHSESCFSQKPSLRDPSWLRGVCIPQERALVQVWKKKPDNWPERR